MTDLPGRTLTTTERAARNARIARARAAGSTWAAIANAEDVSVRQAARAAEEHLRAAVPAPASAPLDLIRRVIETHLSSLDRLDRLARSKNLGVAVAAASRAPAVSISLLDVAERAGLVPPTGRSWAFLTDGPGIASAVLRAAERAGVASSAVLLEIERGLEEADAVELSEVMDLPLHEEEQ